MAKTIKLKVHKQRPKYKYRINDQVSMLPRGLKVQTLIDHLDKEGITRNEFYIDREIPFGSPKSISADRLLIYTKVFDCSIDDLLNQTVTAKPLRSVISKSGLFMLLAFLLSSCHDVNDRINPCGRVSMIIDDCFYVNFPYENKEKNYIIKSLSVKIQSNRIDTVRMNQIVCIK